jgi:hypothetical protein
MNMKKQALVIGLGMGQQYCNWFKQLGYDPWTVDTDVSKSPNYTNVKDAFIRDYDIVYIGTPNWTHEIIANEVAPHARIVLVEKPGVGTSAGWELLLTKFPHTRFSMVKNNQYRSEMSGFSELAKLSDLGGKIVWSRKDGVPQSEWFLDKTKAFGGVSRDLMPHLLSIYARLDKKQDYNYSNLSDDSILGIDTLCELQFHNWRLIACWQNLLEDQFYIEFTVNGKNVRFDIGDKLTAFGGCPSGPYMNMINTLQDNINNDEFWMQENEVDLWIHKQLESL